MSMVLTGLIKVVGETRLTTFWIANTKQLFVTCDHRILHLHHFLSAETHKLVSALRPCEISDYYSEGFHFTTTYTL